MGMNDPLGSCILAIEGSDAKENALFSSPKKTFDQ